MKKPPSAAATECSAADAAGVVSYSRSRTVVGDHLAATAMGRRSRRAGVRVRSRLDRAGPLHQRRETVSRQRRRLGVASVWVAKSPTRTRTPITRGVVRVVRPRQDGCGWIESVCPERRLGAAGRAKLPASASSAAPRGPAPAPGSSPSKTVSPRDPNCPRSAASPAGREIELHRIWCTNAVVPPPSASEGEPSSAGPAPSPGR